MVRYYLPAAIVLCACVSLDAQAPRDRPIWHN